MSTETYKSLVRRFYDEALNGRRVQVIDELALADYAEHDPLPGQRDGLAGLKDRASMLTQGLASTYTLHDASPAATGWSYVGPTPAFIPVSFSASHRPVVPSTSPASTSTGSRMTEWPSTGTLSTS